MLGKQCHCVISFVSGGDTEMVVGPSQVVRFYVKSFASLVAVLACCCIELSASYLHGKVLTN